MTPGASPGRGGAGRLAAAVQATRRVLAFIRFSHTLFALPFALGAMLVAARGWPSWRVFGWILVAMATARTAAMAFNRLADWRMDQRNPRTAGRHRLLSHGGAVALCAGSGAAFLGAAWAINPVCGALGPVALGAVFFYSLTKRFTSLCHFFLGLALAISPVGAWLAVTGDGLAAALATGAGIFSAVAAFLPTLFPPAVLSLGVIFWVAGFDLIYATQDLDFDRREGLHSLVVRLGIPGSLRAAQGMHAVLLACLIGFGLAAKLGAVYYGGLAPVLAMLVYEHRVASRSRRADGAASLAAINEAFFTSNAVVGLIFVLATAGDVLL